MSQIDALLDDLRSSILQADFSRIRVLSCQIETLADSPDFLPMPSTILKAKRNAEMLDAAFSGLKSARRRLVEIEETGRGLSVYDEKGERRLVAKAQFKDRRL